MVISSCRAFIFPKNKTEGSNLWALVLKGPRLLRVVGSIAVILVLLMWRCALLDHGGGSGSAKETIFMRQEPIFYSRPKINKGWQQEVTNAPRISHFLLCQFYPLHLSVVIMLSLIRVYVEETLVNKSNRDVDPPPPRIFDVLSGP